MSSVHISLFPLREDFPPCVLSAFVHHASLRGNGCPARYLCSKYSGSSPKFVLT